MSRYFKHVSDNGKKYGRFRGNTPKQAAFKVLTSICNSTSNPGTKENPICFKIYECTKENNHKIYAYKGYREVLDVPITVNIGDNHITYNHRNHVKRIYDMTNKFKESDLSIEVDVSKSISLPNRLFIDI